MVKRIRLQERDKAILEHIQRYRMTTTDVLHSQFFPDNGEDAVHSTLRRLRGAEYVSSADLAPPKRKYYHLTPRGARLLGLPASYGRPLGEQALPIRFATLLFCCGAKQPRPVMESKEFIEEFPDCVDSSIPKEPYYFDETDGVARLAFIIVDLGAEAGRTVRKCRKAYGEREKLQGFREVIKGDAFLVTVLTSRESKKSAIESALARAKDFKRPVRIEVVEQLADLL